ncbi:hypothetical protein V8E55_010411 [Tylopilus felleus]
MVIDVATEGHHRGIELNAITQSFTNVQLTAAARSQPMSTDLRGLFYTSNDPMNWTEDHVVDDIPISIVNENPGPEIIEVNPTLEGQPVSRPTIILEATRNVQAPCPTASCQWRDEDSDICGATISCDSVLVHMNNHEIEHKDLIRCRWEGCPLFVPRKNIVWHIRQYHLGHIGWGKGHTGDAEAVRNQGSGVASRKRRRTEN